MKYFIFFFLIIFFALPSWSLTAKQYYQAALEEKDTNKQIELYTKAINQAPRYISAYHRRGDAYKKQGKIKKALADYSKIIELSQDPFKYYARGLAYLDIKDYVAAKNDFTSAIKLKNNYDGFYYNRALCLIELGNMKSALSDLKKVKDKSLQNKVQFLEGRANYKLYNYDKAEDIFLTLRAQNPEDEDVILYLARIYTNKEMYDEAISLLSKVINKNPSNETALMLRASALKETGLLEQAIEDYTDLIALNPQATYYNRRGLIYEKFENWEKAKQDYTASLKLNPTWAISYSNRGYVNMKMKHYEEAKKDFELALKYSPFFAGAAVNYAGYYWTAKKDKKNMYKYLDKALKSDFKDTAALYDDTKKGWLFKKINNTLDFRTFVESR